MTDVLDEPSSKKPKLSSPSDFDDDPLSELEKLEPLPSILETMSQTPSSVHMSANNGPGPSSVGSTGATSQPPSVSHGNYMGPASVMQSQAGATSQTHNAQSQQNAPSQPSVLQELLLNPSNQNNQTLSSPRPPYTTQYQTRSPVTSGATMMASANCPPNVALSAGPRGLRATGPQMYGPAGHTDMTMQPSGGPQLGHPTQQSSYVASQMMPPPNQQSPQSLSYAYQQSGSRPVYANTGSRAVYAAATRSAAPQPMSLARGSAPVMLNGASAPRIRATHQGMITMQQGGGQMMRTVMVQQGPPYDQGGYAIPPQRSSDPYGISSTQTGASPNYAQLPQSHMVARNQPMPYTNAPAAQAIQQSSTMIPHMMEHSTVSPQQQPNQQPPPPPPPSSSLTHGNVMPPQMSTPVSTVTGTPGPMSGPKSGIPPNLPPPQMPPANTSTTGQIQQFTGMNNNASREGASISSTLPTSGTQGNNQDPGRRKLIQLQLVLLLHAHKCQQRERSAARDGANGRYTCTLQHCSTMKGVLQHMTTCNSGSACNYPHCPSSRQIISHWKNCVRDDCPVCTPLKSRQNVAQTVDRRAVPGTEPFGNSGAGSVQQVPCGPGNASDIDNVGMPNRINTQQQQQPQQQQQQPGHGTALPPNTNSQNMSAYDSSGPTSINAFLIDFNSSSDPFRSPNPPNKLVPSLGKGSGIFITSKDIIGLPPPDAPVVKKPWQNAVTEDLRNHLVRKLVEAIFPSPDPASIHDQRIKDLVNYARKVEREMFELANDRGEYYHLLAEKIYKIQKELQEKKIKRLHEQGQAGAVAGMQPPQPGVDFDMPGPPNRTTPSFQPNTSVGTQQMNGLSTSLSGNAMTNGQLITSGIKMEVPSDVTTESSGAADASGCCSKPGTSNTVNAEKVKTSIGAVKTEMKAVKIDGKGETKVEERKELPDKVFDANELRNNLKPVVDKLLSMEESIPFRIPVDPDILGIPDYFDIVKKPMDLSTVSRKLDTGEYKNPWDFNDDMWLMFDNAWLYNRKNSKVYKYCNKLSEVFVEEINPVMQKMGYCCGQKLSFTPLALFCYGQSMCTIARDQTYHVYETTSTQYGVTVSERYTYCTKCFEALPESGISLSENPNDTSNMVPKSKFVQMKNDQIDFEPFEKCIKCFRKWHRVCALFNKKVFPEGFICATCRREKSLAPAENRFTAKKLPHCQLSRFIEERVNKFMKNNPAGKDYEVIIRVLCAADKEVEVKPLMKQKYGPLGFPEKFPYRTKAIFAFEVIDIVEVCFFGLHVQEYGSNCPPPNKRRVYIAYLDSVHFFQPRQLRTEVYHEILLGYLNYAMMLGYTMAHIWACPPSEGDDYIFHCHPPEQRIPKPKRLQDWYKKMLDKGVGEHTVFDYKDIYKQARDENLVTPMELSYFEGDFWPNVIEDCIREAQNEEQERKRQEEAARQEQQNAEDEDGDDMFHDGDNGKSKKNSKKKNNLKKGNSKNKKKVCSQTGNEVTDKLYINFEKHKEVFFTIRLMSPQSELSAQNNEIKDPDPLIASDLMDGRDTFLTRARDEHWEFSSLRRAKYSTICFCHALHNQEKSEGLSYTCNSCQGTAIWHCTTCEDFDLCNKCYETMSHPHKLEKVSTLVEVEDKHDASNSRTESIQRCIQSLVHACQCRDANCRRSTCHKMKRVVQHTKGCKKRQNANCAICKQLIALCCYHAKHCNGTSCQVPFCLNIRQKLQEQRRSQNRRADMMMRRRMDMLSSGYGGTNTPGPSQSSGPAGALNISQTVTTHHGTGPMQSYQGTGMTHMHHVQMGQPQGVMASGQQQMAQMQQLQPHQYQTHGKGGAVQGSSQIHMMGVPTTIQQSHAISQVQQQQAPHQQGVRMNMTSQMGGIQRPGMVGQMQHAQQPMNPPPYGRGATQQNAYGMSGTTGPSSSYGGNAGQPMMLGQSMPQSSQSQPIMQQGMQNLRAKVYTGQPIDRTALQQDPQVQAILTRFKNAERAEDKDKVLNDLKKMPHLFAAFIKMTNNERSGGDIPQNLNQQQLSVMQQQQQQQQQQQGMIRQPQMVTQQSGQWQQGTISQQQYYQQQQPQVSQSGQQQPRGPGGQYASMSSQGQMAGTAMTQSQWQQQFQRNPQPVSPAMQSQFSQVRSPPIGRSPSVSNVTQSPMMQPGTAQPGVQQMQQGAVNQDQQPYR
ncbi:hypothetical protein X798_06658 [Onchocerca flexuosa]|uniref:histone acetyltransferase n=2 Tax=Onchocerca flexuosa TaxID=387005 RepID=A0A238BMU8_9BILA|nr:hypothetical protein X798_06658 [Onchocerca flexuosa]